MTDDGKESNYARRESSSSLLHDMVMGALGEEMLDASIVYEVLRDPAGAQETSPPPPTLFASSGSPSTLSERRSRHERGTSLPDALAAVHIRTDFVRRLRDNAVFELPEGSQTPEEKAEAILKDLIGSEGWELGRWRRRPEQKQTIFFCKTCSSENAKGRDGVWHLCFNMINGTLAFVQNEALVPSIIYHENHVAGSSTDKLDAQSEATGSSLARAASPNLSSSSSFSSSSSSYVMRTTASLSSAHVALDTTSTTTTTTTTTTHGEGDAPSSSNTVESGKTNSRKRHATLDGEDVDHRAATESSSSRLHVVTLLVRTGPHGLDPRIRAKLREIEELMEIIRTETGSSGALEVSHQIMHAVGSASCHKDVETGGGVDYFASPHSE